LLAIIDSLSKTILSNHFSVISSYQSIHTCTDIKALYMHTLNPIIEFPQGNNTYEPIHLNKKLAITKV